MSAVTSSDYSPTAYRADAISDMPEPPKKRERIGEELLPFGDYAGIDPYQQICEDAEFVQHQDSLDKAFYETDDWWWDDQRIRFLKSQLGFSAILMIFPVVYFFFLLSFPYMLILNASGILFEYNRTFAAIIIPLASIIGFVIVMLATVYTTQPVFNYLSKMMGFIFKPLRGRLVHSANEYMKNSCSELNRQTGMASFAQGKKKSPLVAPFIEFDGYIERVVQRGGIFYRLMFVHRYTGKQFNQTSLSTIVDHKHEVHALWDMLQRYMDVSQPMPDVPRLEPFRHLDPTTAEHDQKTGRNPRYWRDLDLEAWKKGDGAAHLKAQIEYPWSRQHCQLTPQLGKVEMAAYKER